MDHKFDVVAFYIVGIENWNPGGGGGTRYILGSRCGPAPHTLTLFKTNIADFPTLLKTELRFLIPCLRYQCQSQRKSLIDKSL